MGVAGGEVLLRHLIYSADSSPLGSDPVVTGSHCISISMGNNGLILIQDEKKGVIQRYAFQRL